MVGAATFHAAMVEIVIGSLTLSTICTICCIQNSIKIPLGKFQFSKKTLDAMDKAALAGAILGVLMMPGAILTGDLASMGTPEDNILLYNKFLYSGLSLGFWAAYVFCRIRFGQELWENRVLSIFQILMSLAAFTMTASVASIGGKLVRGESLFDILPFWIPLDQTIVISPGISMFLILIGFVSIISTLRSRKVSLLTID